MTTNSSNSKYSLLLTVQGYDKEGNVFSSLEGLVFEWKIESGEDIVKIVTLKEAHQRASEIKRGIEYHKQHSDVLLLKGLKSGVATISVRIIEKGY